MCHDVNPEEFFSAEDGCLCLFRVILSMPQHAVLKHGITAAARAVLNPLTKLITRIDYVVDTQQFWKELPEVSSANSRFEDQGAAVGAGARVAGGGESIRGASSGWTPASASASATGWGSVPPLPRSSLDNLPTNAPVVPAGTC